MTSPYFCLDVGESMIKIADMQAEGKLLDPLVMGALTMDPTFFLSDAEAVVEKQGEALGKYIAALHINKKNVNIVVPDSLTFNQILQMPYLQEKEMLSAIRYQADQFIPLPLEEINLDVEILQDEKNNNKKLTLISAAPKRVVEKVQKLVEYAGLIPQSLETQISAVGRFLAEIVQGNATTGKAPGALFINMDLGATSLYYFSRRAGLITLSHNFGRGLNIFRREIITNVNISEKKADELLMQFGGGSTGGVDLVSILSPALKDFVSEVNRFKTLVAEKDQGEIQQIYLFNEASRFRFFDRILEKYFSIPTSYFDMLPYLKRTPLVESQRTHLGYFLSTFGGTLR